MNSKRHRTTAILGLALPALIVIATSAGAVPCDDLDADRTMTLTPANGMVTCDGSGATSERPEGQVHTNDPFNFTRIAKVEDADGTDGPLTVSGIGDTSGTIEIDLGVFDLWENVFAVFKFGAGDLSPDWFRYLLEDVPVASWSVDPAQQSLGFVTLYGDERRVPVPTPATLILMGIGLLGLAWRMRRRRT